MLGLGLPNGSVFPKIFDPSAICPRLCFLGDMAGGNFFLGGGTLLLTRNKKRTRGGIQRTNHRIICQVSQFLIITAILTTFYKDVSNRIESHLLSERTDTLKLP